MNSFFDALRFLTRLPVPPAREAAGFGAWAFPLVGLVLGAISLSIDAVLGGWFVPAIRNVAILAAAAVVTGALHYDGLADTLDALGGSSRDDRLRILREGTIGTFAVLGLVLVVAAELAALGSLSAELRWRALLLAPVAGRAAMIWCALEAPLARQDGLGAAFVRALTSIDAIAASAWAVILLLALGGWRGALSGLLAIAASFSLRRMATNRFGGVTGDVLGAAGKAAEVALLLFFTIA